MSETHQLVYMVRLFVSCTSGFVRLLLVMVKCFSGYCVNPLNPELNPICHLLALLGAHHILHVSRIGVNVAKLSFLCRRIFGKHEVFFWGGGGGVEKHCQWNYFNTCTVHRLLFCTMTNNCMYVPDRHDSSVNIKTVYTATTKTDFMRIVATK